MRSKLSMSCSPPPARSIGFDSAAVAGSHSRSCARSPSPSGGSSSPARWSSAAAIPPCPPPSASTATRRPASRARAQQPVGDVDQLLRRVHAQHAGRAAGGVDRGAVGRQRAGVGEDGARCRVRVLDRHQQHGLAGPRRGLARRRERAPVAEVLDVDGDQLGLRVAGELADQLRDLDVGLVADRREAREAEPGARGEHPDLEREVAALRDQPDRPARQVVGDEVELGGGVEDAEAVRAEQHGAGRARPVGERAVAHAARVAVGLARRDHDDARGPRRRARRRTPARAPPAAPPARRGSAAPAARRATRTRAGP